MSKNSSFETMPTKSLSIDDAWSEVLTAYRIIEAVDKFGMFDIKASELIQYKEPRLMCKLDHIEKIPPSLNDQEFTVLAIRNSVYRIARTYPYIEIDNSQYPKRLPDKVFELPRHLTTLPINNITSEAMALDVAFACGMIEEITDDKTTLTIRGRRRATRFDFSLIDRNHQIVSYPIDGVQIEVDGGYEGHQKICLIETKMGLSSNMGIRQLLYPHLHFINVVADKPILSYYLCYEPVGLFHFLPFCYIDEHPYFDYEHYRLFQVRLPDFERNISKIIRSTKVDMYPTGCDNAPFPQANDFNKVLTLIYRLVDMGETQLPNLFIDESLDPRQHNYYIAAARWLGLAEQPRKGFYQPTSLAKELTKVPEVERLTKLAQIFYSNPLVHTFLETDEPVISDRLRAMVGLETDSTFDRRLGTVLNWKRYFNEKLDLDKRLNKM